MRDYEYERAGTASVFLFSEPLACWRRATARARRTKADWAVEVADLLEGRYADCPKAVNTQRPAPSQVRRLEFCSADYDVTHGRRIH